MNAQVHKATIPIPKINTKRLDYLALSLMFACATLSIVYALTNTVQRPSIVGEAALFVSLLATIVLGYKIYKGWKVGRYE